MLNRHLLPCIGILLLFFSTTSCKTRKNMVYFQASANDTVAVKSSGFTPVFKVDDFLSITVIAEDPEAVKFYNQPPPQTTGQGYTSGNPAPYGYLVDAEGKISLPVIGKVVAVGKSRMQLEDEIIKLLEGHLKTPSVHIQILNFKITVLGDVRNPGTFKIPNERLTVLEAIGLAGDLRMSGQRANVLVIRDSNGVKSEYRLDLTKKDLFSSPAYYLQQNDVVYVEPNAAARSEGTVWRTAGGIFISLTSLVLTTISIITR